MNGDTIYQIVFTEDQERFFFFGSMTAIFDMFTPEQVGISKQSLWNYGLTLENPYRGKRCVIRKGVIYRTKTKRRNPMNRKQNDE